MLGVGKDQANLRPIGSTTGDFSKAKVVTVVGVRRATRRRKADRLGGG